MSPGAADGSSLTTRRVIRVSSIYATGSTAGGEELGDEATRYLRLGRLASYYNRSSRQLPRVIERRSISRLDIGFTRWERPECVRASCAWQFVLTTGQLVAALTLDVECGLIDTVDLLEDCYYEDLTVSGRPLGEALLGSAPGPANLLAERHQIVFVPSRSPSFAGRRRLRRWSAGISEDELQRVIHRADLPYRPEHSSIVYPGELNRRFTATAAVGPYVSVFCGQQDYIENGALLSAVQGVGAAARLREIRADAYDSVRELDPHSCGTAHVA